VEMQPNNPVNGHCKKNPAAACTAGYLNQLAATTFNIVCNSSFTHRLSSFHLWHWLLSQKHISIGYSAVSLLPCLTATLQQDFTQQLRPLYLIF